MTCLLLTPLSVNIPLFLRQATMALCAIVACGVSLSNAAHASQSPQSNTPIAGRLFNSLTVNDRWYRIYRSQQRSLSLGKGLMFAETVAQTDVSDFYI